MTCLLESTNKNREFAKGDHKLNHGSPRDFSAWIFFAFVLN